MLTENLFEKILIEPAEQNFDTLYIVSGYASATMVSRHLDHLSRCKREVRIQLIVGMAIRDGISAKDHKGFRELASEYKDVFLCGYVASNPPVHSKTYAWCNGDIPRLAFIGSANYTQAAFSTSRREAMIEYDAERVRNYFDLIQRDTINCLDPRANNFIAIYSEPRYSMRMPLGNVAESDKDEDTASIADDLTQLPRTSVSFLGNRGDLPQRSGLNWGQRAGREPNQAYIRLPIELTRTDFFPPRGEHFTILTDDNKALICVRRQDYGKAIHTPDNNSRMGLYFRHRLNVPEGMNIRKEDLEHYGRTDVDFYKIDEETYYMDFSV